MSGTRTYQSFPGTAVALVEFAAGRCRRHVEIDGHVIDLVQVMAEQGRPAVEPEAVPSPSVEFDAEDRAEWDRVVAANVRNALAGLYVCEPAEEVARPKPGPVCPCCLRPEDP